MIIALIVLSSIVAYSTGAGITAGILVHRGRDHEDAIAVSLLWPVVLVMGLPLLGVGKITLARLKARAERKRLPKAQVVK